MRRSVSALLFAALLVGACGGDDGPDGDTTSPDANGDARFPTVVAVEVEWNDDGTADIHTTISSPYDSAERYADAWRVLGPDGAVLGVRELLHHHAAEQPFTRSLNGVALPRDITEIEVEGRDLVNGWGGPALTVSVSPPSAP